MLRRAIVLLELYDPGFRKNLLKVQDVANVGSSELINALIIVADYA